MDQLNLRCIQNWHIKHNVVHAIDLSCLRCLQYYHQTFVVYSIGHLTFVLYGMDPSNLCFLQYGPINLMLFLRNGPIKLKLFISWTHLSYSVYKMYPSNICC
jgi:hypothetical protein